MKTGNLFGAVLIGVATGAAMSIALGDMNVGIALGAAAFAAFGGLSCRGRRDEN